MNSQSDIAAVPVDAVRAKASLIGLACGDALGTTLEFMSPGTFTPITDMVGGGPFGLQAGEWTDDTSMALCLAESLLERRGFDARDQMARYVRWWRDGYMSSTGRCFDIGNATSAALSRFARTGEPFAGDPSPQAAGNGSLMRLAPAAIYFSADPRLAVDMAAESSRTTHSATTCVDACRYMAALLCGAVRGASSEELLSGRYEPVPGLWNERPLCPEIEDVAAGSFRNATPPQINASGYVVRSLEAALWALYHASNFAEGALFAANLGDDADTVAAIYGQLAGAVFGLGGADGIPETWRRRLALSTRIEDLGRSLAAVASAGPPGPSVEISPLGR